MWKCHSLRFTVVFGCPSKKQCSRNLALDMHTIGRVYYTPRVWNRRHDITLLFRMSIQRAIWRTYLKRQVQPEWQFVSTFGFHVLRNCNKSSKTFSEDSSIWRTHRSRSRNKHSANCIGSVLFSYVLTTEVSLQNVPCVLATWM